MFVVQSLFKLVLQLLPILHIVSSARSCRDDGDYSYSGLTSIPRHQPGCVLFIWNLRGNCIKNIPSGALEGYSHLTYLDVSENELRTIEEGAFHGAIQLETLNLSYNDIWNLNLSFKYALSLGDIHLDHNRIQELDSNDFSEARMTENINLGFNQISIVSNDTFSRTPELRTLNLTHNRIATLDESVFDSNINLIRVDLQNNRLRFLPLRLFSKLSSLTHLVLSDNPLFSINFVVTSSFIFLQACNCSLAELPNIEFDGSGGGIVEMDVGNNKMECNCYILEMTNGSVRCIDEDTGAYSNATCFNKEITTVSHTATGEMQSTPVMSVQDKQNEAQQRSLWFLLLIPGAILVIVMVAFFVRSRRRQYGSS